MIDNKKEINFNIFYKSLFCQKYFIWNKLEESKFLDEENSFDNETNNNFWELDFNDKSELNFISVHKKGFEIIENKFQDYIIRFARENHLRLYINSEKTKELKRKKTLAALDDENIDLILYPQLEYKDAYSSPSLYNKKEKKLTNFNYVSSTKSKDLIRAYYDYQIFSALNIEVNIFSIITLKIKNSKLAREIDFEESEYAFSGKTKQSLGDAEKNIKNKQLAAFGKYGKKPDLRTIIEKITIPPLISKSISPYLTYIDGHINYINSARKVNQLELNLDNDKNPININPEFMNLASIISKEFLPISFSIVSKDKLVKNITSDYDLKKLYQSIPVANYIYNKKNHIDKNRLEEFIKPLENSKIVWYDFEGFSMPFNILAHTFAYQQLVFQVSVIKTQQEKIYSKNNLVIDPQKLSVLSFLEIIDAIYDPDTNHYVVFNKNYENTRLKEMLEQIQNHFKTINQFKYSEYKAKVNDIICKTIDLADPFISRSGKNFPMILLHENYGYYSIKKIEKYITKNKIDLELLITPYSELEIKNGLSAMEKAISRYLNEIGDEEWIEIEKNLKLYCENDVKAMIMVYFLLKKILYKDLV